LQERFIDGVVNAGANNIYGLQFTLTEDVENEARTEAYEKATQKARIKAEGIARGLEVQITGVKSISDSSFDFYPVMRDVAYALEDAKSVDVASGDVDVTASVTVSYSFR